MNLSRKRCLQEGKGSRNANLSFKKGCADSPCAGASPGMGSSTARAPGAATAMGDPNAAAWPTTSEWLYPPGGFMNYLQRPNPFVNYPSGSQLPENSHFVGATIGQSTMTASPTESVFVKEVVDEQMGSQEKDTIDIDDDDDDTLHPARTGKRLYWSKEEDSRLVIAWLQNSLDPVDGNDKKSDKYWADVTATYNSTTESNRTRNINQMKIRWDRIKKPVSEFQGCWVRTTKVYQSGKSDDQLMDEAMLLYASEHNKKDFTLVHLWKILRNERKWSAYVKRLNKEKEKSTTINPAHVMNVEDDPNQRPMGHKKAKDLRNGKQKPSVAFSAVSEKLDKFIEANNMARKDREKISEVQQTLADKKLEAAKFAHKAAKEQTKCKMLDTYRELMFAPTSHLSEEALAERGKCLESLRLSLFSTDD